MKAIRKMVGPVIWIMLLSFMFWGVQSVAVGLRKETHSAGKVFGKDIPWKDFHDEVKSAEFFLQSNRQQKTPEELETLAWQNIIFELEADTEKITVSDDEVLVEVRKLFGGDVPNPDAYETWTSRLFGEHPRNFEERVRKILKVRKLIALHRPKVVLPAPEKLNPEKPAKEKEAKEAETKKATEQEKVFSDWWNDILKRAKIEKFKNPDGSEN